ncbi:MAG: NUDIX domain-containing protein [Anaerolineales bacterium]|jgi:8-oxo-dGTP pyrophosphatase MutT (NUDIX family)
MLALRNSAKAVIIQDQHILVIKKQAGESIFYTLPGGGQKPGETLPQALERECMEELGIHVKVGNLLYIREYIGKHHEFANTDSEIHQVDFLFACKIIRDESPVRGDKPDKRQVGIEWLPINQLDEFPLYPAVLRKVLRQLPPEKVYLGDVN